MDDIYYATIAKHEARGTFIRIYMDDIGIATKVPSFQAHVDAVSDVLQVAQEHSLYFKPEKCTFHVPSMEYLGLVLERTQMRMDPVKVAGCNARTECNLTWVTCETRWLTSVVP